MWIKDYEERYVNLSKWDFLDLRSIEDTKQNKVIAYRIYLYNLDGTEHTLGYIKARHDEELMMKSLSQGVQIYFNYLDSVIYYHLEKEHDEMFGKMTTENFDTEYEKRQKHSTSQINKRFKESS